MESLPPRVSSGDLSTRQSPLKEHGCSPWASPMLVDDVLTDPPSPLEDPGEMKVGLFILLFGQRLVSF